MNNEISSFVSAALGVASMVVPIAVIVWSKTRKTLTLVGNLVEDWYGEDARPGWERRPGIPERVRTVEVAFESHVSLPPASAHRLS